MYSENKQNNEKSRVKTLIANTEKGIIYRENSLQDKADMVEIEKELISYLAEITVKRLSNEY